MSGFVMHLQSATQYQRIDQVVSFIGEDASGHFGILPGHARMMTMLGFGLARFRVLDQDWEFLALPGALTYFCAGQLYLSTRRYLRAADYETVTRLLRQELRAEEEAMQEMKESIHRLEEEMVRRLGKLKLRLEGLT
jgi:F-type H+-transporting ATPase subunit epsilon